MDTVPVICPQKMGMQGVDQEQQHHLPSRRVQSAGEIYLRTAHQESLCHVPVKVTGVPELFSSPAQGFRRGQRAGICGVKVVFHFKIKRGGD